MKCEIDTSNGSVMVEHTVGGRTVKKTVSWEGFKNAINVESNDFEELDLPYGTRCLVHSGNTSMLVLELKPGVIPEVKTDNETYTDVAVPGSVWLFRLTKRSSVEEPYCVTKTIVYAYDDIFLTPETDLKLWPMPNSTASYGVCWGDDSSAREIRGGTRLINLESLPNIYFNSKFNDDLNIPINGSYFERIFGIEPRGSNTLFSKMSGLDLYPNEVLISANRTLAGAVNCHMNNID